MHHLRRIRGLARRSANQFDCGVSEYDTGCDDHQLQYSGRQDAAVVGDDGYPGALPFDGEPVGQEDDADEQEGDQRHDLDQRGPEIHFAENTLTEIMLMVSVITRAITAMVHCGIASNAPQ
jgi:hypothetical protein